MSPTTTLISLAAEAPAAAQGAGGMTAATLVVLVAGILYCLWHKGTDWPTALIFTVFGLFLAASSIGIAIKSGVSDGSESAVATLLGLFR